MDANMRLILANARPPEQWEDQERANNDVDSLVREFEQRLPSKPRRESVEENVLIVCVGLPRSGKSTWARAQGYPVVNPDSIRLALHGQPFIALAEPFVWATAKVMVRSLFLAGHTRVILDATNVTRKRRDEWKGEGWAVRFRQFLECDETCWQRAVDSGRPELIPVIERMAKEWEPLGEGELQWPL